MGRTDTRRTPGGERHARLAAWLLALGVLAVSGCSRRSYREIHATNVYYHHLSGTEIHTHARYD